MTVKSGLGVAFAIPAELSPLEALKQRVFDKVPPLRAVTKAGSVRDYLAPLHEWQADPKIFPYAQRSRDVIADHMCFYFGEEDARGAIAQLERASCVETGTHLSFPRDHDDVAKKASVDNTMVWQGVVLSAMAYQAAGMKYHIGAYAGTLAVNNTNGPLYLQFGRTNFMVPLLSGKKMKGGSVGLTPALTDEEIDALSLEIKKKIYEERVDELQGAFLEISKSKDERIESWRTFIRSGKGYSVKNDGTLSFIQRTLSDDYGINGFYDYSGDRNRIEKVTFLMKDVVSRARSAHRSVSFADQVVVVQKYLLDEIMPVGMTQIGWDLSRANKELMIEAFRDPQSAFYQIFANPELREAFIQRLGNIRTGWKYNGPDDCESPFWLVRGHRTDKVSYREVKDDLIPERIADALEKGKWLPTVGLEFLFTTAECGFMCHGAMFQCQYAPQYASGMASILEEMGLHERAGALKNMPLHIATQSLAFGVVKDNGALRLARYSDFLAGERISSEQATHFLNMPAETALALGAPSLICFLDDGEEPDPVLQKVAFEHAGFGREATIHEFRGLKPPQNYEHKL